MAPILEVKNLHHVYSAGTPFEHIALNNVSFSVERGEFVGIIGHTGSGKSTLMQHLNGLLKATSGSVLLDGKDIWSDKTLTRQCRFRVGLVFQYPENQLFEETVYKDIAFGPKNIGLTDEEIDKRVKEAIHAVNLDEDILEKSPFELSGGQKRRVAIAGVMAMEPKILILDEPTAGLDPHGRDKILAEIDNYHKETGSTILLISHSMEDIAKFSKKILVMNKAEVYCYEETAEVFRKAEELSKIGLDIPQITKIALKLKERGFDIGDDIYTVKEATRRITALLNSKGGAL